MFGEDCIASYLIIGCWNQVSWGVLKSINGLAPGGHNLGKQVETDRISKYVLEIKDVLEFKDART